MGERSDGTWAAKQVGVSAPRQNGKSQLIVARALAGALLFGEKKIVISAHAQDTARETFAKFVELIDDNPALAERVDKVMNAINREFIKFTNGATVQFKARTVSGSRGFSSDCLLLDEAQILGMPAWVSINSTMSARPNPQVWLLGTPPTPENNGEVFTSIRDAALGGKSQTLAWLEWAALPTDDPAAAETRAKANPAWWTRINHEIVQGEYETYPPERFALDRLGIWATGGSGSNILPGWLGLAVDHPGSEVSAIGLAVSIDGDFGSIAQADVYGDDLLNLDAQERGAGSAWLVAEAKRIQDEHDCAVAVDEKCPDATLIPALEAAGVRVTVMKLADYIEAWSDLVNRVREGRVTHQAASDLDNAVAAASLRSVGDGRKLPGRKASAGDIDMLEAAVAALWGARADKPSVYEDRGALVL
jgi:hypothetical protein